MSDFRTALYGGLIEVHSQMPKEGEIMTEKKTKAPKTTEELILKYVKSTSTSTAVVAIVLIITLLASCIEG